VVAHAQVHQLVQEQIVAHGIGHLHKPPVQADATVRRARSPPRALIPDADSSNDETVKRGELIEAGRQTRARQVAKPTHDRIMHGGGSKRHDRGRNAQRRRTLVRTEDDVRATGKEYRIADRQRPSA
jgi:hypothetical protein